MLLYDRSEGTQVKKFILLKVIPVNNVQLDTICFLITGSNCKILSGMVIMI